MFTFTQKVFCEKAFFLILSYLFIGSYQKYTSIKKNYIKFITATKNKHIG